MNLLQHAIRAGGIRRAIYDRLNSSNSPYKYRSVYDAHLKIKRRLALTTFLANPTTATLDKLHGRLANSYNERTADRILATLLGSGKRAHAGYPIKRVRTRWGWEARSLDTLCLVDGEYCHHTTLEYDVFRDKIVRIGKRALPDTVITTQETGVYIGNRYYIGSRDQSNGAYTYRADMAALQAMCTTTCDEVGIFIRGVQYHKVHGPAGTVYLSALAMADSRVRGKYDSKFILSNITAPLDAASARYLTKQPDYPDTSPAIGIELELENITSERLQNATNYIRTTLGWPYSVTAVRDGSLQDGVEFVTGWGDPDKIANTVEAMIEQFGFRKEAGGHMKSTCGLHIHVGRTAFLSDKHIADVQWVLERRAFKPVVSLIAGRYNSRYCKAGKTTARYHYPLSGKYRAVSNDHADTIEFRIFAAPRNEGDVPKYKDFVLSIIEWQRDAPTICTPAAYIKWVTKHQKYSTQLLHFLKDVV